MAKTICKFNQIKIELVVGNSEIRIAFLDFAIGFVDSLEDFQANGLCQRRWNRITNLNVKIKE